MSDAVTLFVNRLGGNQRVSTVVIGAAALAVIWAFAQWGMTPRYVPVAAGLSIEEVGDARQRLRDSDIDVRLEQDGRLLTVPEPDAAEATVLLASAGLTGDLDAPGFELFDEQAWGMTDFTQQVNYRRALEGELERTIGEMRGVESAQVHLAMSERSFLRSTDQNGEASIVLSLRGGNPAAESVVAGVQSLVAYAVRGVSLENVIVIDDTGRLLSAPDDGTGAGSGSNQLKLQTEIEHRLERKAQDVVDQLVGPGNAIVRVAAQLNFDQIDRTTQAVDPNQAALVSEERAEITPGTEEQGAGSVQTTSVFEATRSVENVSRGGAQLERLTVAVAVSDRRTVAADGTVTFQPRTPQELQQVEALVSNAVGVTVARGDQIEVVAAPFETGPPEPLVADESLDYAGIAMAAQRPLIALAGLAMALVLTLKILGTIKSLPPGAGGRGQVAMAGEPMITPIPAAPVPMPAAAPAPGPAELGIKNPEMTAQVLRSWMQDA